MTPTSYITDAEIFWAPADSTWRLSGRAWGDLRWCDGTHITTSSVKMAGWDFVVTKNSVYRVLTWAKDGFRSIQPVNAYAELLA